MPSSTPSIPRASGVAVHYSASPAYIARVAALEASGLTTSDAQGVADLEFDPALCAAGQTAHLAKRQRNLERQLPTAGDNYEVIWSELVRVRQRRAAINSAK